MRRWRLSNNQQLIKQCRMRTLLLRDMYTKYIHIYISSATLWGMCSFGLGLNIIRENRFYVASRRRMDFQKPKKQTRWGEKTYLVQFKYPNDVRFSMLIITHPQTTVRGRKKDRASLKNESSWLRGTRTISPHRQQPRNVSFFHPSVKKRRWIYPQLLICTFCFAVQRRWTTSNQSTIKKKPPWQNKYIFWQVQRCHREEEEEEKEEEVVVEDDEGGGFTSPSLSRSRFNYLFFFFYKK